jgi:hypothetical protein
LIKKKQFFDEKKSKIAIQIAVFANIKKIIKKADLHCEFEKFDQKKQPFLIKNRSGKRK